MFYICKEHRTKKIKNVERLMLAGFSFKKAYEICGYNEEEAKSIYQKVKYIEIENTNESKEDDDLDIEIYVGNDGRIMQKPFDFNASIKENLKI